MKKLLLSLLTIAALSTSTFAFAAKATHHKTHMTSTAAVNINKADASQIATLKGIGAKKAARIVAYRQQHGAFNTFDDLDKVKGISANSVKKLEKQNPGRMKLR